MKLHLDLEQIFLKNLEKQEPGMIRKNGMIINTGDNMTKKQQEKLRLQNQRKFGLSQAFVVNLNLPKVKTREWLKVLTYEQIMSGKNNFSTAEKIHHLKILRVALERKLKKIVKLRELATVFKPCNIGVIVKKCLGAGIGEELYEWDDEVEVLFEK